MNRYKDFPLGLLSVKEYRKPCPFYKNGLCTAPSLQKPTDAYTNPERCLTIQHYTCTIYMDAVKGNMWRGLGEKQLFKGRDWF